MIFTEQQILDAIRDPNYKNKIGSGPFGYPYMASRGVTNIAAKFCYASMVPRGNTLLEIQGFSVHKFVGEPDPNVWAAMMTDEILSSLINTTDPGGPVILVQDPNVPRYGLGILLTGTLNSTAYAQLGLMEYGSAPRRIELKQSIVLFGPKSSSKPPRFILVCVDANVRFLASFFGREWPLDSENYNP